MFAVEVNV